MLKTIDRVVRGASPHWVGDGFKVSNYFPAALDTVKRMSPFFLLDYHTPLRYDPTTRRRGVGAHPHRGFETVTIAYQGAVAHHDSAGNAGVIRPGEVQWMTAGQGILHNEYHEQTFSRAGGVMHMAQIWVNLPRKHKLTAPKYQAITNPIVPEVLLSHDSRVRVIAGTYGDARGAASTFSPVQMLDVRLGAGGAVRLPTPKSHNTALLVLEGAVKINGEVRPFSAPEGLLFKHDGDEVAVSADTNALLLFLSGEPLDEPIVHYGPFVMNTADEINEAIEDYNAGKFGVLSDPQ
jgi:redox-sensitive bicupin YhaK (pirin superfamily)